MKEVVAVVVVDTVLVKVVDTVVVVVVVIAGVTVSGTHALVTPMLSPSPLYIAFQL
jgi:hypothetical protein